MKTLYKKTAHHRRHAVLEAMYIGILSMKEMAMRLQCSYGHVAYLIRQAGYRNRLVNDAEWAQILNARKRR